jgi:hypothetical protein
MIFLNKAAQEKYNKGQKICIGVLKNNETVLGGKCK